MCRQSEKNLLSSNTSSTCPDNMVNFGPLTGEIGSGVWGTPTNFNGFCILAAYCTASSSGRQPNFAALNRGRHLCSAGRPSGWALAHILVWLIFKISKIRNIRFVGNLFLYSHRNFYSSDFIIMTSLVLKAQSLCEIFSWCHRNTCRPGHYE